MAGLVTENWFANLQIKQAIWPLLAAIPQGGGGTTAYCKIKIKKSKTNALIDTGSTSCSFIDKHLVTRLKLPIIPAVGEVSMANASFTTKVEGECIVDIQLRKRKYEKVKLYILDNLCAEVNLGQDFMEQHKSVVFNFGGRQPSLIVSALTAMNVTPPRLFEHLTDDCRPVAVRSRKQTPSNAKFIRGEVKRLLNDGIIKSSTSPWCVQVLMTKEDETHRKRMVVDYKQSINRFTELDAYPLPDTEEMVREISQYSWFSTFDLKSAYHQIPISGEDQKYTAFKADGGLWEFTRISFGVTNVVSKFQSNIDLIVEKEGLPATFPFLDNVSVCECTEHELKENEAQFRSVAKEYNLTLNESKSVVCVQSLPILGYLVSHGEIKPEPERLLPLKYLVAPCDLDSQRGIVGMFAYYSQWIPKYSEKIRPLNTNRTFPLPPEALKTFQSLKEEIEVATPSACKTELNKLLGLQKRAMRLMTYNDQYPVIPGPLSPSNPIFIKLELPKIEEIFKYYISKFIFKCLLQLTPINFHSWFTASSVIHNYRTRSNFNIEFNSDSKNLFIPSARTTNYGLKQITVSSPKIWNDLPYWIKNNTSLNIFLKNLKVHLLANY